MAFNSTLWRPDPGTVMAINRGNRKARESGHQPTEADAYKKARAERVGRMHAEHHPEQGVYQSQHDADQEAVS